MRNMSFIYPLLICSIVNSQNLVPNPSFDTLTNCPTTISLITEASPWISPSTATPDLYNSCAGTTCGSSLARICVPINWKGNQLARTGNGYAGSFSYTTLNLNYREYIQVSLSTPLIAGQNYEVSFYINLSDKSNYATNGIGAYLSNTAISITGFTTLSCCTPQITNTTAITDKNGWGLISDCYVATGGEQFVTIGNFDDPASINLTPVTGGILDEIYYYVDDVSVIANTSCGVLPIELITFNAAKFNDQKSLLTWQTASEINNDYFTVEQSNDAINWKGLIQIDGAGNSSTQLNYQTIDNSPFLPISYYRLKQTDFNGNFTYSNIKTVSFNGINLINVYPNPTEGFLTLNIGSSSDVLVNLDIINSLGQYIIQQQFYAEKGSNLKTINTNNLSSGMYHIKITTPDGEYSFKKFNKK